MTREEYEAARARYQAELDAEKARVFGEQVPGVEVALADRIIDLLFKDADFPLLYPIIKPIEKAT